MQLSAYLDRLDAGGSPPSEAIAYLSPTAGSFTLDGRSGLASYVWYHGDDLTVDWHSHALSFEGTVAAGGITFWVYGVGGHGHGGPDDHDHDHSDHGGDRKHLLFADRRTSSDRSSDSDEGYRIFYGVHGELHLMAWDAKTFAYHDH
ncbi:MAG TPA: hypothetical protein VEY69_01440 [Lautropia sp.]|nr:hypothetical protein [Lautropia sp.]